MPVYETKVKKNTCAPLGILRNHGDVAVAAFSKWPEVAIKERTTTKDTIDRLRELFARWRIPAQHVSYNGPNSHQRCFRKINKLTYYKTPIPHSEKWPRRTICSDF